MIADDYAELLPCSDRLEHYDASGARVFRSYSYDWTSETTETHLASFKVPIKIWHGTSDTETSHAYSEALIAALRKNGVEARFQSLSGAQHTISTLTTAFTELPLWLSRF